MIYIHTSCCCLGPPGRSGSLQLACAGVDIPRICAANFLQIYDLNANLSLCSLWGISKDYKLKSRKSLGISDSAWE